MGLRSSKNSPKSYDIAPVVSDKDFSYKRTTRPLPTVKLPEVIVSQADEAGEQTRGLTAAANVGSADSNNAVTKTEQQQVQATSTAIETPTTEAKDPRIPPWVVEENFKPLLIELYPNFSEIIAFKAYPALAPGENYATLMLRIKITIKLKDDSTVDQSFMLKVAHDNKEMLEMLKHMNFFDVENAVYNAVIPEMEEMYKQVGVDVQFGAKAYQLAPEAPKSYYVLLEDLSTRNFKNANRLECLDMEHTLAVLRKLAQFHAASVCRIAAKGNYNPAIFSVDMDNDIARGMMTQMFSSFKKPFMDNLKTYENGELYEDAMNKFFDNVIDEFVYGRTPNPDYLNVLNHGDAWSNNILFNYTPDGKVNEVLFVDFQNTNYGSPAQDLFYFLISSARVDIKVAQYEYFVRYYHQHLEEHMKLLGYPVEKVPTLRELHMQLISYGSWATVTSFLTMGVVLLDPTDNAKFENFMGEEKESMDFKHSVYSNPRYRKYINEVLPWLFNRGFMETHDLDKGVVAPADKESVVATTKGTEPPNHSYPEWVNEAYFDDVIRADFENYQKIVKFDVSPATSAGDNYSSIMLKVDLDIELQDNTIRNISYMLKIPPAGEQAQALVASLGSFVKEITAYGEIIPKFEKVFKEQAGKDVVFGPKSYKPPKDNGCQTLILENLRLRGFKNGDRLQGLDMDHTKAVLEKMAQLHAASAYVFETQGNFPNVFERSIYTEEFKKHMKPRMDEFYDIIFQCVKEYEGSEEYIDGFKNYLDNAMESLSKAFTTDFSKFNVLNHGDCWTNNIMFQHGGQGEIVNTYFVDFQLMKYGTPAYDLYYFLMTSPKLELKLEYFDYFIRYYHENLQSNLQCLKYPKRIPTLSELHVELLDEGSWALYSSTGVMGAVLLDPTEEASLEEMMKENDSGNNFKKKMFSNQRYRSHAQAIFPWISRRGLMEC